MYILLFFFAALLVGFGLRWLVEWALAETPEDSGSSWQLDRDPRNFNNPRTWAAYQRLLRWQRPVLISSRRDRRGRFRKMS